MEIELRRVTADDWRLLRDVRMRALADSPDAFATTLEQAGALTDEEWRGRAAGGGLTLIGLVDGRGAGMGGAIARSDGSGLFIWGMWVDPAARGLGLGGRMLDALVAWCRDTDRDGASYGEVRLHVTEGNAGARRLYVDRGFRPTGRWESLREGSPLRIEELALAL